MKNRIALKAEPRKTVIVLLTFTIISLFLSVTFVISVNKHCMQLNSLIRSSYDYSVTTQDSVFENDYYQFNAGIDFSLSAASQTSLNADIIMQTDKSTYSDLVYWNAKSLSTRGIAVSKNISKINNLSIGDKLYSKHIVNGEVCAYAIEQIIPETVYARADKSKRYSNGIIIMGYDADYVSNITCKCVVFTNESINKLTEKCTDTPQDIIYRDDEIHTAIMSIIPYLAIFSMIAITATIIIAWILTKYIACNFLRLIMLGFEKKRLNQAHLSFLYKTGVVSIIITLFLSNLVFFFVDITVVRIILIIWLPLIELLTLLISTETINRRLWRK